MEDIMSIAQQLSTTAFTHTDLIIAAEKKEEKFCLKGVGSVSIVSYKGKEYAITCKHVTNGSTLFFSGSGKGETNHFDEKAVLKCKNMELLLSSEQYDIAIFSGYNQVPLTKKTFYPLEKSDLITFSKLSKEIGTLCSFTGVWAKYTQQGPWNDLMYFDTCYVSAFSGIQEVRDDEIVADFAAKDILNKRIDVFPKLKEVEANGGTLNFRGCSGCGLWVSPPIPSDPRAAVLIGILLGRIECDTKTQHLIHFTPIWKVKELLDSL